MDGSVVQDFKPSPEGPVLECSVTADSRRWLSLAFHCSGAGQGGRPV